MSDLPQLPKLYTDPVFIRPESPYQNPTMPVFDFREGADGNSYTMVFEEHITAIVRRVNVAMETAAREEVITWLRAHGYTVIEPGCEHDWKLRLSCSVCGVRRDPQGQ